ncbi:hypothetical protein ACRAWD_29350 [Caulobacter segnis]
MALKTISLRASRALVDFLRDEAAGGYVLMVAACPGAGRRQLAAGRGLFPRPAHADRPDGRAAPGSMTG